MSLAIADNGQVYALSTRNAVDPDFGYGHRQTEGWLVRNSVGRVDNEGNFSGLDQNDRLRNYGQRMAYVNDDTLSLERPNSRSTSVYFRSNEEELRDYVNAAEECLRSNRDDGQEWYGNDDGDPRGKTQPLQTPQPPPEEEVY
jgi:hypothetical protein